MKLGITYVYFKIAIPQKEDFFLKFGQKYVPPLKKISGKSSLDRISNFLNFIPKFHPLFKNIGHMMGAFCFDYFKII